MEKRENFPAILRFSGTVALIDLGIFAAVSIACWFGGGCTAYEYGGRLFWAGIAAIVIGFSSIVANWGITRSFGYQYGQSVSEQNIHERLKQERKDTAEGYRFLILMTAVGVVAIVMGALIQTIAR